MALRVLALIFGILAHASYGRRVGMLSKHDASEESQALQGMSDSRNVPLAAIALLLVGHNPAVAWQTGAIGHGRGLAQPTPARTVYMSEQEQKTKTRGMSTYLAALLEKRGFGAEGMEVPPGSEEYWASSPLSRLGSLEEFLARTTDNKNKLIEGIAEWENSRGTPIKISELTKEQKNEGLQALTSLTSKVSDWEEMEKYINPTAEDLARLERVAQIHIDKKKKTPETAFDLIEQLAAINKKYPLNDIESKAADSLRKSSEDWEGMLEMFATIDNQIPGLLNVDFLGEEYARKKRQVSQGREGPQKKEQKFSPEEIAKINEEWELAKLKRLEVIEKVKNDPKLRERLRKNAEMFENFGWKKEADELRQNLNSVMASELTPEEDENPFESLRSDQNSEAMNEALEGLLATTKKMQ